MDPFVLMVRSGVDHVLADPAVVGLAWRLEELEPLDGDSEDFESEREIYARGYRWCLCFSLFVPDGESGHLPDDNLLPLTEAEFEFGRRALSRGPDAFRRALDELVDRAAHRLV